MLPIRTKKWAFIPLISRYIDLNVPRGSCAEEKSEWTVGGRSGGRTTFLVHIKLKKELHLLHVARFFRADLVLNNAFCSLVIFILESSIYLRMNRPSDERASWNCLTLESWIFLLIEWEFPSTMWAILFIRSCFMDSRAVLNKFLWASQRLSTINLFINFRNL